MIVLFGVIILSCKKETVKDQVVTEQTISIQKKITTPESIKHLDLIDLAKESYFYTFDKQPINLEIVEIKEFFHQKTNTETFIIIYKDDKSQSSFALVKNNGETTSTKKNGGIIRIDCSGCSPCNELYYPETGAIECNAQCNDCYMDVQIVE